MKRMLGALGPPLAWVIVLAAASTVGAEPTSQPTSQPAGLRVAILVSPHPSYQEPLQALTRALASAGAQTVRVDCTDNVSPQGAAELGRRLTEAAPRLVVAFGGRAAALALRHGPEAPVVFTMVPNALDLPMPPALQADRRRLTGVTTDVAPDRQIAWIAGFAGKVRRIGIMHSSRTQRTAQALADEARKRNLTVVLISADKENFVEAAKGLNAQRCDAALMLPDAAVYTPANVQHLLLWGIRQKHPVAAFSANIAKAGALAAQYPDGSALGEQTAQLVLRILRGEKPEQLGLQYPQRVLTAVNERTTRLIDLKIEPRTLESATVRYGREP